MEWYSPLTMPSPIRSSAPSLPVVSTPPADRAEVGPKPAAAIDTFRAGLSRQGQPLVTFEKPLVFTYQPESESWTVALDVPLSQLGLPEGVAITGAQFNGPWREAEANEVLPVTVRDGRLQVTLTNMQPVAEAWRQRQPPPLVLRLSNGNSKLVGLDVRQLSFDSTPLAAANLRDNVEAARASIAALEALKADVKQFVSTPHTQGLEASAAEAAAQRDAARKALQQRLASAGEPAQHVVLVAAVGEPLRTKLGTSRDAALNAQTELGKLTKWLAESRSSVVPTAETEFLEGEVAKAEAIFTASATKRDNLLAEACSQVSEEDLLRAADEVLDQPNRGEYGTLVHIAQVRAELLAVAKDRDAQAVANARATLPGIEEQLAAAQRRIDGSLKGLENLQPDVTTVDLW